VGGDPLRDLTQGSITRHLLGMAGFIGAGLVVQTLYLLVDLYFVAHLGSQAVAGVAAGGSTSYIVMAATQLVSVGALALISQAVGRKDDADAEVVFEQSLSLALALAALTLLVGYTVGGAGVSALSADAGTAQRARAYLYAFLPALAAMFPAAAMSTGLRAGGVVGPPMIIQSASVVLNVLLAPVLIAGWGTGHAFGTAGAGAASSIGSVLGLVALTLLFNRLQDHLKLRVDMLKPRLSVWRRIAAIGAPSAGELLVMFLITSVAYWAIRSFGATAQAGFGIGARIMQSIFLPAMAVSFAAAPIAGQNFGARQGARVRATFVNAALIGSAIMLSLTALCQIAPAVLVAPFTGDPAVVAVAAGYLRISSFNFVGVGLVFACSGMFQALGDTRPSLVSSSARLLIFALPALWLAGRPGVPLSDFWRLSVFSVAVQAVISLLLLRALMNRKVKPLILVTT
jgi:putative MATE family efflux protein